MAASYIEIIRSDGRVQRHDLAADRVTVGSGPDASISIPDAPELEPMHLLVAPRDDGCWVSAAREAMTPPRRNGAPFENGLLPWGTELDVGALMFRFGRDEVTRANRRRWMLRCRKLALLTALLWLAYGVLFEEQASLPRTDAEPPELFAELPSNCPGHAPEAAGRGREAFATAQAKAERYPFAPRDGVEAVYLFARAAACLERAGDRDMQAWAAEEEREMLRRVQEDYRVSRLRLTRALDHRRYIEALIETQIVSALLRHRDGPYVTWLEQLDRALRMRVAK